MRHPQAVRSSLGSGRAWGWDRQVGGGVSSQSKAFPCHGLCGPSLLSQPLSRECFTPAISGALMTSPFPGGWGN